MVLKPIGYSVLIADKPYDQAERYRWEDGGQHRDVECPPGRMRFIAHRWALPIPYWLGSVLFKLFGETSRYD